MVVQQVHPAVWLIAQRTGLRIPPGAHGAVSPSPLAGIAGGIAWRFLLPSCFFLRSGREAEEESPSGLANGVLAWVSRDLGCVLGRRLAWGCARGLFLQQQELQLV